MSSRYANEPGPFKCRRPASRGVRSLNHMWSRSSGRRNRGKWWWTLPFSSTVYFIIPWATSLMSPPSFHRLWMKLGVTETSMSCALDRISSNTVSLLKRHYSIDDVLSRASFLLRLRQRTLRRLSLAALCRGGPSNRYHYWVSVMVRVPRLSLNFISTWRTVHCCHVMFLWGYNKAWSTETYERLISSVGWCVKAVLTFRLIRTPVWRFSSSGWLVWSVHHCCTTGWSNHWAADICRDQGEL